MMPMALGILRGTPWWVFLLAALLVWLGVRALRPRVTSVVRVLITPAVFVTWGVVSFVAGGRWSPAFALAWLLPAFAGVAIAVLTVRMADLRVDRGARLVLVPASVLPLVRNLTVFSAKYVLAIASAIHPEARAQLALWDVIVSGVSAGYFLGWLARFVHTYRNAPTASLADRMRPPRATKGLAMRFTMPLYFKLAIRNVFRNRRRTLITLAAMGFGAAAIIVFGGFVHAIYFGVRESTIRSQIGHIQLYRRGYSEKGNLAPYDYLIRDYGALRTELSKLEHVKTVTARLGFSGLVSTGDTTTSFVGTGVDPDGETDLSSLAVIVDGEDLVTRDPRGVTLGVGLARAFGVKPGDDLTLLTTTKGGGINALAVRVRGAWESGEKAYDDRFLRVGITEVQRLLDIEGDEVQSIVLLLDKTEHTALVRARVETLIRERGLDLELRTWDDLALRYHQVRELFGRIFAVLTLIVSIMVVFGITNTMTMAIFERTREIGTIRALGTRRRGVIAMFVLEGVSLGVLGGVAGVVLGIVLARAISAAGIQLPPPPGSTRGFLVQIFVVPEVLTQAFRLSLVTAALASIYPAWRAARVDVVEALRHV